MVKSFLLMTLVNPVEVALFDDQLPGMNGIECIRKVEPGSRKYYQYCNVNSGWRQH